ncbi:MAG: arginine repressor [Acidobacteriota bacterium]|jgi:transcriptional regulator of arginine metabolism|nr:arginine repressor [Acidobacteriota bacterium]
MVAKKARQARIVEIVRKCRVDSQEALAALLAREGVGVAQTTLSRDIRELGLVKVRGRYHVPPAVEADGAAAAPGALRRVFGQFVLGTDASGNIVVVRTSPGGAHSVGVALDAANWPEILGTVAGDDTIFVLARSPKAARRVLEKFNR